jgi:single-strand DNA-binding protein
MDKANFEIVGNVGKVEIKSFGKGASAGKLATLSVATSERWKTEDGTQKDRTYWHRVTVFSPTIIARIESMVQKGTRVRLIGRIRPGSYDDDKGRTRYVIEFVLGPFSEMEILARGKTKPEADNANEELPMEVAA